MESFSNDEEFLNPNLNYQILLAELRERIEKIQKDMLVIQDHEVMGAAQQIYTELKLEYFRLMRDDLDLQHKFSTQDIIGSIERNINVGDSNE